MGKFGFNDILNAKSKAAGTAAVKDYTEIWLNPKDVKPSENNFYSQENIEELADSFLAVGQQQPTVLGRINGEFRIVSGHRRNLANIMNLERGHEEYKRVRYLYKDMTEAMLDLSLIIGNAYNRELTAWEKTQQAQKLKEALLRAKKEDGLEITGKLRDVIADLLNESSTNIARMDSINKNATPEIKEQFAQGNIGISAAYEAAKLAPDEQREIAQQAAAGADIRAKEIAAKAAEKKAGDDYETPHPESITSLCYSCLHYQGCNVKTGTCEKCDQYRNKAEAEKTEEQRYSEEQDRIDRETKKALREQADREKMESGPEGSRKKYIRVSGQTYMDISNQTTPYLILKDEGFRTGQVIVMQEFEKGRATGRLKELYISCMDTESTQTAIMEGYCVLGICERKAAEEKGWLKVSETDMQIPGQITFTGMNPPEPMEEESET